MPDNIETDILTSIGPVDNIHAEWEELTLRSPGNTFSNGPEYGKLTHQIAHRNGDQSRIITARIEGQLVGIWPIILHNEATLKVLRPPSCGSHEEYGHPLVDCRFEGEVLRALLNEAINIPCDRLMIMNARLGSVWSEVLAELPAEFRPELPSSLPGYRSQLSRFGSWQDYVASGAKSHLAGLARQTRRLEDLGQVDSGWCRSAEEAQSAIAWLFSTKRAWAVKRGIYTPWLFEGAAEEFFKLLATTIDLTEYPLITFIKSCRNYISVQINLVSASNLELFIIGYDLSYAKYSPGEMNLMNSFRMCIDRKIDFDFRFLPAAYKIKHSDVIDHYTSYAIHKNIRSRFWLYLEQKTQRIEGIFQKVIHALTPANISVE